MIIMCTVDVVVIGTNSASNDVGVGHNIDYEKHYRILFAKLPLSSPLVL